jgi:hypothetical protein
MATILAPIVASFGVLWLTNRHNARTMRAQHDLLLQKEKLATIISKAEQVYHDLEKWKRHLSNDSEWRILNFQTSKTEDEYYERAAEKPFEDENFDLVRLGLGVHAYFPVLMPAYTLVTDMLEGAARMQMEFPDHVSAPPEEKDRILREFMSARDEAFETLEMLSEGIAAHIAGLVGTSPEPVASLD